MTRLRRYVLLHTRASPPPHTHAHNHAERLRGERTEPPSWEIHCGPPYASRFLMRISGPLPGQTFDRAGLDTLRLRVQPQRAVGGNHPSGLMASRRCSGSPTYRDLTRESCVVPYPAQPAQPAHRLQDQPAGTGVLYGKLYGTIVACRFKPTCRFKTFAPAVPRSPRRVTILPCGVNPAGPCAGGHHSDEQRRLGSDTSR